jgi:hypothetical protein
VSVEQSTRLSEARIKSESFGFFRSLLMTLTHLHERTTSLRVPRRKLQSTASNICSFIFLFLFRCSAHDFLVPCIIVQWSNGASRHTRSASRVPLNHTRKTRCGGSAYDNKVSSCTITEGCRIIEWGVWKKDTKSHQENAFTVKTKHTKGRARLQKKISQAVFSSVSHKAIYAENTVYC